MPLHLNPSCFVSNRSGKKMKWVQVTELSVFQEPSEPCQCVASKASSQESLQHGCIPDTGIHTSQPFHASSIRASPEYHLFLCCFSLSECFRAAPGRLSVICMHGVRLHSLFPGENKTSVGQPFNSAKMERSTKSPCQLGLFE